MTLLSVHTISRLLERILHDKPLTDEEQAQFAEWLEADSTHPELLQRIEDPAQLQELLRQYHRRQQAMDQQLTALLPELSLDEQDVTHALVVRQIPIWRRWGWAAAVLVLLGAGAYLWTTQQQTKTPGKAPDSTIASHDIRPGSRRATLTLSNGQQVTLNPSVQEQFKDQSQVIRNAAGQVSYAGSTVFVLNTLTTPRGGEYELILPDRSHVWLNAASSITYPTAFTGTIRGVSITGEAYFEVAPDKNQPFVVKTASDSIAVLGTSFNVNAYPDEPAIKTSLVNGRVRVGRVVLRPGEAFINGTTIKTNIDQDIAWKNGLFNFDKVPLDQVLRQLARWYDLTVVYEHPAQPITVFGEMGRDLTLSQVLSILSDLQVKYRLEGNKLIIL